MAAVEVMEADQELQSEYLAPSCDATGDVRSTLFHPHGYSLWELDAELAAGAQVRWHERHGDEVVFVLDGELEIDGLRCLPSTAAFVEAGVAARARALTATKALHFGPASVDPPTDGALGPARGDGRRVHVVGADDATPLGVPGAARGARYYSDSTCETCRAALLEVFDANGPSEVGSHVHSQDEIIHVLTGELRVGRLRVGPGMSIAIPGNYRYGFRAPGPFSFVNYRRDVSEIVLTPGNPPRLETVDVLRSRPSTQGA
jgi:quercetin dioxygenase-like cupin family protein